MKNTFVFVTFVLLSKNLFSQAVYTPKIGSKERIEILDTVRKPVQKDLKQEVKFIPSTFRVNDKWGFIFGQMQQKDSKNIDKTKFLEGRERGDLWDNMFVALLQKKNGLWEIVKYQTGCTDVCWEDWSNKFNAPKMIIFGQ
jgi:hypothetical protein